MTNELLNLAKLASAHPYVRNGLRPTDAENSRALARRRLTPDTDAALEMIAANSEIGSRYADFGRIGGDPEIFLLRRVVFALATAECSRARLTHFKSDVRKHMGLSPRKFADRLNSVWANVSDIDTNNLFSERQEHELGLGDYEHLLFLAKLTKSNVRRFAWSHNALQFAVANALLLRSIETLLRSLVRHLQGRVPGHSESCDFRPSHGKVHVRTFNPATATAISDDLNAALRSIRCARAIIDLHGAKEHWTSIRSSLALAHLLAEHPSFAYAADNRPAEGLDGEGEVIERWLVAPNRPLANATCGRTPRGLTRKIKFAVARAEMLREKAASAGRNSAEARRTKLKATAADRSREGVANRGIELLRERPSPLPFSDRQLASLYRQALRKLMMQMQEEGLPLSAGVVKALLLKARLPEIAVGGRTIKTAIEHFAVGFQASTFDLIVLDHRLTVKNGTFNQAIHAMRAGITFDDDEPG